MRSEEWWKGRTIHKAPQYPFFIKWVVNRRQLAVLVCHLLLTAYCSLHTEIGEHIEKNSVTVDCIHIRVIRGARRPSLLTPNSSLLTKQKESHHIDETLFVIRYFKFSTS